MWRHLVAWLREKFELHSHQDAVQSGQIWPSLLVADLLLQWVVFEDHENTFPCSVTSLVDTRKPIAYPPHKPKRVVKLNDGAASPSATSWVNCWPRTVFFLRCSTAVLNFAKLELTNAEITAPLSLDLSLTREEAPIGFLAWICSALRHGNSGGARHPSECRRRVSASTRTKKKVGKTSWSELYFLPSPNFSRERQERQKTEREVVRSFCPPRSIRYFRYKVLSGGNVPAWQGFHRK